MLVEIYGYASASADIDASEWEAMSTQEKKEWAAEMLAKEGTIESHELSEVKTETGESIRF